MVDAVSSNPRRRIEERPRTRHTLQSNHPWRTPHHQRREGSPRYPHECKLERREANQSGLVQDEWNRGDVLERNSPAKRLRGVVGVGVVVGVFGVVPDQNSVECHFWNTYAVASP